MYKKIITRALLCSVALSTATGIIINANDGLVDNEVAIGLDLPIPNNTEEHVDILPEAEAPSTAIDSDIGHTPDTVESSEDTNTSIDTNNEGNSEENNTEVLENEAQISESDKQDNLVSSEDLPSNGVVEDHTSDKKENNNIAEPKESVIEDDHKPKENHNDGDNFSGNLGIVEDNTPNVPTNNTAPSYNHSNSSTNVIGNWTLTPPNATPNQQSNNRPTGTPGSMLNYRVIATDTYHPLDPTTWRQGKAPYSNEFFAYSGTNFGDSSCGIHTLAALFLKTGYAVEGFNAVDAYNWSLKNGFGENNNGMPAYAWSALEEKTGGYLENANYYDESSGTNGVDWVRQEYQKGNFVVMGTTLNGVPHVIALDYVDNQGQIVTLDSGGGYQFLSQQDSGHIRYAFSFKVAGIPAYNSPKLWAGENLKSFKPIRDAKYKHFAQEKQKQMMASNN